MDELGCDGSYLSQHAVGELAFGLGSARSVDRIEVLWPDGTREEAGPFPADSLITWMRGEPPRAAPLPGKPRAEDQKPPPDVQRRFYALRDEAGTLRLAGEHERAVELYRAALGLWPAHADCLYYLANALVALGREREALAALEELVAFHPMQSAGWVQLGRLRLPGGDPALDDLDAARQAFERAHELNREESGPVVRLGEVALLRGRLDEARRLLADAAAMNPKSAEALYLGGKAAWLAGDRQRASDLLARARSVAGTATAGKSNQHEGNTRTGNALVEQSPEPWLTLAARDTDAEQEFGGLAGPAPE
jgi:tetratricopeptide (TPR) repeat protein